MQTPSDQRELLEPWVQGARGTPCQGPQRVRAQARAGVLSAAEGAVILPGKVANLVMAGKFTWRFLEVQTFRKCKIVLKVPFLLVGFFFSGVITGASCNHGKLRLVHVSLACEDVTGLQKRTKDKVLNMVSEAGRCLRTKADEVDTVIASCQG